MSSWVSFTQCLQDCVRIFHHKKKPSNTHTHTHIIHIYIYIYICTCIYECMYIIYIKFSIVWSNCHFSVVNHSALYFSPLPTLSLSGYTRLFLCGKVEDRGIEEAHKTSSRQHLTCKTKWSINFCHTRKYHWREHFCLSGLYYP